MSSGPFHYCLYWRPDTSRGWVLEHSRGGLIEEYGPRVVRKAALMRALGLLKSFAMSGQESILYAYDKNNKRTRTVDVHPRRWSESPASVCLEETEPS